MWFEISLMFILFAINVQGQENSPVQCFVTYYFPVQDILFILQTPNPIRNSWEVVIVLLDSVYKVNVNSIRFDFDIPVEVNTEFDGIRTQLANHYFNDYVTRGSRSYQNSRYKTQYIYQNQGKNINIIKLFVRNSVNNATPHLTGIELNEAGVSSCVRLRTIQWDMIHLYKIFPTRNAQGSYTLTTNSRSNSPARDLTSYINDVYSTRINSQYSRTVQASSSCGKRIKDYVGLITNGYSTRPADWPWHAALFHAIKASLDYKCGGSLITRNAILTAAHCVHEGSSLMTPERIIIRLGLYNKLRADSYVQEFQVQKIIPHGDFSTSTLKHDIAILQLATQPVLSDYVQPVCLWLKNKTRIRESEGLEGYVIGWGVDEKKQNVEFLSEARMPVVSHEDCLDRQDDFYGRFLSIYSFCAGFRNGTSVCNGDSGGGMFFQDEDGLFRIRGIVSVSLALENNACNPNEYVIFTNVGRYLDWIENTIAEHF